MKKLIFTSLLSLSTMLVLAQTELSFGINAPVGDWGSTKSFQGSGFAKPGFMIEFASGNEDKALSMKFATSFGLNGFKKNKFEEMFTDSAFHKSGTIVTGYDIGRYFWMTLGIGPEAKFEIAKDMKLSIRALGNLQVLSPPWKLEAYYNNIYLGETAENIGGGFVYEILGVSCNIGAGVYIGKMIFRVDMYRTLGNASGQISFGGLGVNAKYPSKPTALQFKAGITF